LRLTTPRWWYLRGRRAPSVTRVLLAPIAWIWTAVTARRIARTVGVDPGTPAICVGNITMGGAGKTPITRELLRLLTARGLRAHGLSRGHGGRLSGPVQVDPAHHSAAEVGDEPLMLARDLPIWISRDRLAGAQAAAAAGAQAVVMDDGFQNPRVKKVLSLVVVDGETRRQALNSALPASASRGRSSVRWKPPAATWSTSRHCPTTPPMTRAC